MARLQRNLTSPRRSFVGCFRRRRDRSCGSTRRICNRWEPKLFEASIRPDTSQRKKRRPSKNRMHRRRRRPLSPAQRRAPIRGMRSSTKPSPSPRSEIRVARLSLVPASLNPENASGPWPICLRVAGRGSPQSFKMQPATSRGERHVRVMSRTTQEKASSARPELAWQIRHADCVRGQSDLGRLNKRARIHLHVL
jgi:hypothetical protein